MNSLRSPSWDDAGAACPVGAAVTWSEVVARHEPQSPLRITFTRPPATLRLSGVIDESTHELLTRALSRAAQSPERDLLIDMSGVDSCDLCGVRAIMSLAAAAPERVTLTGVPAETRMIIHILGWQAAPGVTLA